MPTRFSLLLILLAATSGYSQQRDRVVLWGGDPSCGYKGAGLDAGEKVSCSSIQTPRGSVSVIDHDGLSLAVGFVEEDGRMIAGVMLKNSTDHIIEFNTDIWGAAYFLSADAFYKGGKPIAKKTAIPSRDIVRGVMSDIAIDDSSDVFMAGITKSSEVREIRNPDGTRTRKVVIIDDPEAKTEATERGEARAQNAGGKLEKMRKVALVQKWVAATGEAKGLVYFRRVKKARLIVYSFKVGDTVYMFRQLRNKS